MKHRIVLALIVMVSMEGSPAAGYLATGPIRTDLADDGELNGFWGRLGYSVAF